jgi:predicted amidohydrolase
MPWIVSPFRIALANLRYPSSPEDSVARVQDAIASAHAAGAGLVAFPEGFVPGYRAKNKQVPPADAAFLERAWSAMAAACAKSGVAAVVGTERFVDGALRLTALVVDAEGKVAGFQDKVQMDPSEEGAYSPGDSRRVFRVGALTVGVVICHEGWRYPETARWAARRGAQLIVHPHFDEPEPGDYAPTTFADPANTFHEKALLCRAAENTCYVASVNVATPGSATTSAVVRPDGTLLCYQPYGEPGLLIADLDLSTATGFLASRLKAEAYRDAIARDPRSAT